MWKSPPPLKSRLNFIIRKFRSPDLKDKDKKHAYRQRYPNDVRQTNSPLLNLPIEIFDMILGYVVDDRPFKDIQRDFLALAAVNLELNLLISRDINICACLTIYSKRQAAKLLKTISKTKSFGQSIRHIVFVHPAQDFRVDLEFIGYSQAATISHDSEKSWAELILEIVAKLPNLESLNLRGISPRFEFPLHLATTPLGQQIIKSKLPNLKSIFLSSESGWTVAVTQSLLWPFGSYKNLYLHNMVADQALSDKTGLLATSLTLSQCLVRRAGHAIASGAHANINSNESTIRKRSLFGRVENLYIDGHTLISNPLSAGLFPSLKHLNLGLPDSCSFWPIGECGTSIEASLCRAFAPAFITDFSVAIDAPFSTVLDCIYNLRPSHAYVRISDAEQISQCLSAIDDALAGADKDTAASVSLTLLVEPGCDLSRWSHSSFDSVRVPFSISKQDVTLYTNCENGTHHNNNKSKLENTNTNIE